MQRGGAAGEGVEEEGVCVVGFFFFFQMETQRSWPRLRGSSPGLHVQIQKALRRDLCGNALVWDKADFVTPAPQLRACLVLC